jgi:hypothetical protein
VNQFLLPASCASGDGIDAKLQALGADTLKLQLANGKVRRRNPTRDGGSGEQLILRGEYTPYQRTMDRAACLDKIQPAFVIPAAGALRQHK